MLMPDCGGLPGPYDMEFPRRKISTINNHENNEERIVFENGQKLKYASYHRYNNTDTTIHMWWLKQDNDECLHRIGNPAMVCFMNTGVILYELWYNNGKLHRLDGPASIEYINGRISSQRWGRNGIYFDNHALEIIARLNLPNDYLEWSEDDKLIFKLSLEY